jgi:2-isopropylmalate synthase
MKSMPVHKYKPYEAVELAGRTWPSRTIESAPLWCSVDLRDGNQALVDPMDVAEKLDLYRLLIEMGFKEIEVGFPSASRTEYDFLRLLVEENRIPDDVTIQVLTQAREHLIEKTFEAIRGVKRAIVHLYNSTSALQRRVVFGMDRKGILGLAVDGARMIRQLACEGEGTEITYEYSPESFTGTELDFALDVCVAVGDVWQPTGDHKMIINLPATMEMSTPNVYADRIEWFSTHINQRDAIVLSIHPHNDRGTAVAAAELAFMAGAERIEGTLFGNGERTGNVDIVTLAMNLVSQGVDPRLDLHDIDRVIETCERCTKIPVHVRHPYAGALVYTAFSGSHQDAISKGMKRYEQTKARYWEVPYLPIDPTDVGRSYESIIRINSQSGKGGVAYVMEKEFGMVLPKQMHPEFASIVQGVSDSVSREILPDAIWEIFVHEYLSEAGQLVLKGCTVKGSDAHSPDAEVEATVILQGREMKVSGTGNGPIDAFSNALTMVGLDFKVVHYAEHALSVGSDARAAAYVQVEDGHRGAWWGVGVDHSIHVASFKAIVSALNRAAQKDGSIVTASPSE